jgi:hypothetical protein
MTAKFLGNLAHFRDPELQKLTISKAAVAQALCHKVLDCLFLSNFHSQRNCFSDLETIFRTIGQDQTLSKCPFKKKKERRGHMAN